MQRKYYKKTKKGFTLLVAIITTSMLLIVSFVVVNIALKQLILASASRESQYAFYAADGGTECAVYWDLKNVDAGGDLISAFDPSIAGEITCSGQVINSGSQSVAGGNAVPTTPAKSSLIGGGGVGSENIFWLTFDKGCAIVRVTKDVSGDTTIDSRGYNTCVTTASRRFERGVTLTY